MIALDSISKAYGGQEVLRGCSWRLGRGERIGLVGPNGAGKTTLCRILAGEEEPDRGRVHRQQGVSVGYLPQDVGAGGSDRTVLTEALSGFDALWRLEAELEALGAAMARPGADPALTERYGALQHRFEALGGYELEARARVILGGLGFAADVHRPLAELSGGWRMRAALARLLLLRPDVLLLDEPTNHLDLASLGWLEGFLAGYEGSVVLVAHDRYFLNRMATAIAELEDGSVTVYPGDYDGYVVEREARRALREARARSEARRVAEIERFIERFRSKASKARQVQSRIKLLARLPRTELGPEARTVRFAFPQPPRTGRVVAELRGLYKAYGERAVYTGVDFVVERGERVALLGPNGAGKSTLLKILAGVLPLDRGERTLGTRVAVHYYAQHQLEALGPGRTVLEELGAAAPEEDTSRLRTLLGRFLFSGDQVDKRVAVLSGGEKARLALARMLVRPAGLLCLDEPTNHLDLASKEVLEGALAAFTGTIVFISHDRYFINRLATRVLEIQAGRLTSHLGDYDDYLARSAEGAASPAAASAADPAELGGAPPADRRSPAAAARRALEREVRAVQTRLTAVEAEIHALEARLETLGHALADPHLYGDAQRVRETVQSRGELEARVAGLMQEWEDLAERLASVSGAG